MDFKSGILYDARRHDRRPLWAYDDDDDDGDGIGIRRGFAQWLCAFISA